MNLDSLVQWIHLHPHWGGFITMLISAAESVAIIGTIVPGSVMMTAIGTLMGTGVLPITSTVIWAIAGAIIGDGVSYWLGYTLKDRIRKLWPFSRYPKMLEVGENFFRKHGAKSVFFGRFVGPVRAIVPVIAGMIGMKPVRFYTANVLSAIAWAPLYMVPGFLLGAAALQLPPNIAIHFILSLLVILAAIIFFTWLIRLLTIRLGNRIHKNLDLLWLHLQKNKHEHFLTVWFKSSDHEYMHGQLRTGLAILVFAILLIILAINVSLHGDLTLLNQPTYYFFRGLRIHGIDQLALCITFLGEKTVLFPMMIVLIIALFIAKRFRTAWHCLGLVVLVGVLAYVIKWLVHATRPGGIYLSPLTYSFPSGHVTLSVAFYGFITMLLLKHIKNTSYRKVIYYFYIVLIALIFLSRLYLGAHWLTDVVGGLLLGATCFLIIKVSYYREPIPTLNPKFLLTTTFLATAVFWAIYFICHYKQQSYDYQRVWPTVYKPQATWWKMQGDDAVYYRNDRLGYPKAALNIQWAGNYDHIQKTLTNNDWQTIQKFYWSDFLHPIKLAKRAAIVPIIPQLFRNSSPSLVLVKRLKNDRIIVLRLWDTHIILTPNITTLWVGSIEAQAVYKHNIKDNKVTPSTTSIKPLDVFTKEISQFDWKLVPYAIKRIHKGSHRLMLTGKLLLIQTKPQALQKGTHP